MKVFELERNKVEDIPQLVAVRTDERIRIRQYLMIFLVSVITLLICTKSSPLYPFNDWVDSNIYFTVGKSLIRGKVLYRDIFDHKGPVIFFIHTLASMISYKTFFGVFLFEVLFAFSFLLLAYKTMRLFLDEKCIILIPVLSAIVYSSQSMCHGDSAEELCLPIIMYAVYLATKTLKNNRKLTKKELFWLGVTSGFVFWMKFTIVGFYIGFIVVPMVDAVRQKSWWYIKNMVMYIGLGLLAFTLPILIYFVFNNALKDLWDVYFHTNLFMYAEEGSFFRIFKSVWEGGIKRMWKSDNWIWLLAIGGFIWLLKNGQKKLCLTLLLMYLISIFVIFSKGTRLYYGFIFAFYAIFGLIAIYALVTPYLQDFITGKTRSVLYKTTISLLIALIIPFTYSRSTNSYMLQYKREDLPQYKFARIINKDKDATLLNYGFMDGGFYTVAGIVPSARHFCYVNLNMTSMHLEQDYYVKNGIVDYVVTRNKTLRNNQHYELCSEAKLLHEGRNNHYRLYKKKL